MGIKVQFSNLNNKVPVVLEPSNTIVDVKTESAVFLKGEDGATFTPSVSDDGILTWTNDKSLDNPAPVDIRGPQGEPGQKGVDGIDGKDGKDGYTPIKGIDYFDGLQGPQGEAGKTGPQGPQGPQGLQGSQGIQGERGPQGAEGPKGETGPQGIQGIQGQQGPMGPQGETGPIGPQGEQGPQGIPGQRGEKGEPGDPGPKGDKGDAGADGFSPSAKVEQTSEGARITIIDKDGTTTAMVRNGNSGTGEGDDSANAVLYIKQALTEEQKVQARSNINAVSMEEVEELLGIEKEFSVSGELVEFDLDIEPGTELNVISKIYRDSTWGESNKLVLHHISGDNFVDLSSYLGGAGTVYEKNGITATINEDCTMTIRGTNSSTGWTQVPSITDFNGDRSKRIYPAGTYRIPSGLTIQIRAAQYPADIKISGLTGNLSNKFVAPQPFRIVNIYYAVAGGASVDKTIPLGLFRNDSIPETGYEYVGNIYTATFDNNVYDGEYNWSTGELKDSDGNTVAYYESQPIKSISGVNYFWTGFGENTVSNKLNTNLEKVIIRLGESAPEETVPSICDFMLTPITPEAAYNLYYQGFHPGGKLYGSEVPVMTTKGMLVVKDADGNVKYSKYIEPMFNTRGVSDVLTHKGLEKKWSKKFYLTKEPVSKTYSPPPYSGPPDAYIFVWEFDESEFESTGIPAKIHDIPMASPCFINNDKSENNVNTQAIWGGTPYPAVFSYDEVSGKYILTARGLSANEIKNQLTVFSKVHFYYQLETPYYSPFTFAMGIESGDKISFEVDLADNQPYIDAISGFKDHDVTPVVTAFIPRNVEDAMDGMTNAAMMLNMDRTADGNATVQGYSWIGEGDGATDYTARIQQKLDEISKVTNGGTIYLGPGTYPISKNLIVYGNTRIIGDGKTVIKQTADNTHALILSGSNITIKDLTVKLSGACTVLTACMYVNSENHPNIPDKYDSNLPENIYAQNITVENVLMTGAYQFDKIGAYSVISEAYENYKGVGIYSGIRLYFNYAHIDNVNVRYLMAGVYGGGGSNYINITFEYCKYGLYINEAGNNTYFVNGHSYYSLDENGNYISMSDAIAYVEYDAYSTYHLRTFDTQGYKNIVFLGSRTQSNKIDISHSLSMMHSLRSSHPWNILSQFIVDYGRANTYNDNYKHTPFHVGSSTRAISGAPQLELSSPVIQNALSGAGIWGNISSNVEFANQGIPLSDVCRYPSEKKVFSNFLPYIVSKTSPSADNPIEIVIDYSNRPVIGIPNYFIQFSHNYVASDYIVSFDTTNTGVYDFEIPVSNNTNVVEYYDYPQIGEGYTSYRMKIRFTKPLQVTNVTNPINGKTFDYNPDGLIGICNIGMTVNDYAGRSFLGECGGSLYGNVDMHKNTLKNLPSPVDNGDAVSKAYVDERISEAEEEFNILPTISAIDAGKFLRVSSEGKIIAEHLINVAEVGA